MTAPEPAWITPCEVVSIIDGDTLEVRVTRNLRVRLLDCWCPESRTRDLAEKERGLAAKEHMRQLAEGMPGILRVPTDANGDIAEVLTLGRVLGELWINGKDVAREQRVAGHATRKKP